MTSRAGLHGTTSLIAIRCSALSTYADCPRRAAANLFRKEIEAWGFTLKHQRPSIGSVIGTAVHAGTAAMLKAKVEHDTLGAEAEVTDLAIASLRQGAIDGVMMDEVTNNLNTGEKQIRRMLAIYREQVAPTVTPLLIEERLEAEVAPGIILTGHPDLVAREFKRVRDTKTGVVKRQHRPQVGGYSLLARSKEDPIDIESVGVDFIKRVRLEKPQPDVVSDIDDVGLAESAATNVVRTIAADLKVFREGDQARHLEPGDPWSFLANPMSMLCSSKYCSAAHTDWCQECPSKGGEP